METIFTKIQKEIEGSGIEGIKYVKSYPKSYVKLTQSDEELIEDETIDTFTPLVKAMEVITKTIKENGCADDDIEIALQHLPGEETWRISIGDGR